MKAFFFFAVFMCVFTSQLSAQLGFGIYTDLISDNKGQNITGYYHADFHQIIIDAQKKDTIIHFLYDSSFKLQNQYSVFAENRTLRNSRNRLSYVQDICLPNGIFEIFASGDSISLFKLNFETRTDIAIASIVLKQVFEDEKLVAVLPKNNGCDFLTFSGKKKKAVIYKWLLNAGVIVASEIDLPKSTLSKLEIKEHGGSHLEIKYKALFSDMSINQTNKPAIFQFPSLSQLFYNDSCIYIINKSAFEAGINVFKINTVLNISSSTNYFVNKVTTGIPSDALAHPFATIYDSLLILQNCSSKKFEYYFFNLITGRLIARHETTPNDSLHKLVHSSLRQIGTFVSAAEEKQLSDERKFIKAIIKVVPFIKPIISKDSIILTFGAFVGTPGMEGMFLSLATGGFGSLLGIGATIGNTRFIPYLTTGRYMFLYAHSKFSLNTLQPSTANNITTYLDDIVNDKKLKAMQSNNAVLIELPQKLYIGIYNKKTVSFDVDQYQQH